MIYGRSKTSRRRSIWLAYPLLSLTSIFAQAKNGPQSFFEMSLQDLLEVSVITGAAGFEQQINEAPASVSVVSREEWQAMGARSLMDVINYISGANVSETTLGLATRKISIRGISGTSAMQVKILLDGRSLNFMQDGGLVPGRRLTLAGLKRIEVIKGPGSAIYGADAFGGVVNLVSLDADDKVNTLRASAGTAKTSDVAFEYGNQYADIHWHVSGEYQKSQGDSGRIVESDIQSIIDSYFSTSASEAPGIFSSQYEVFTLNSQIQWKGLEVDFFHMNNQDASIGAGIGQALDPQGSANYAQEVLGLSYDITNNIALPGRLTLHYDYQQQETNTYLHVYPKGTVLPIGSDGNINLENPVGTVYFPDGYIGTPGNRANKQSLRALHLFKKAKHYFRWELGAEKIDFNSHERKNFGPGVIDGSEGIVDGTLTDLTGTEYVYIPSNNREVYFLSLQDEWQINNELLFTLGLRYDDFSDVGETINPRASLIWNTTDWLDIKTFAGSAFRAPSFVDLYSQNNPSVIGNTEVQAETIDTYELAFNFNFLEEYNFSSQLSVYQYEAREIINYLPSNNGSQVAQNSGSQNGKGLELEFLWRPLEQLNIKANTSKLFSNDAEGESVPYEAHSLSKLSINWKISQNISSYMGIRYVGDRYRAATDTRSTAIDDYWLADTKITFAKLLAGGDVSLKVNNLFDYDAKDPSSGSVVNDFPLAGRQFLLEYAIGF